MILSLILIDMQSFELDDMQIDVIRHSVRLLMRDLQFDSVTYRRNGNEDALDQCIKSLVICDSVLSKVKF